MTQDIRNKIYAAIGTILALAVILGWITENDQTTFLGGVEAALTSVDTLLAVGGIFLAWWKSRSSKVTVVEAPKADVETVTLVSGATLTATEASSASSVTAAQKDSL